MSNLFSAKELQLIDNLNLASYLEILDSLIQNDGSIETALKLLSTVWRALLKKEETPDYGIVLVVLSSLTLVLLVLVGLFVSLTWVKWKRNPAAVTEAEANAAAATVTAAELREVVCLKGSTQFDDVEEEPAVKVEVKLEGRGRGIRSREPTV